MLSLVVLGGLGLGASAQQVKYGFKAGISSTTFKGSESESSGDDISRNLSFYGGVTADIPAGDILSIQPGLLFIGKGSKTKDVYVSDNVQYSAKGVGTVNPFYIELPVNFLVNIRSKTGKLFVGAGPYVAVGVAGKIKFKGTLVAENRSNDVKTSENIVFGDKPGSHLKFGDAGVNFLGGYELTNGFNIHGGYSLGLNSISYSDPEGFKTMNRGFTAGIGYSFK